MILLLSASTETVSLAATADSSISCAISLHSERDVYSTRKPGSSKLPWERNCGARNFSLLKELQTLGRVSAFYKHFTAGGVETSRATINCCRSISAEADGGGHRQRSRSRVRPVPFGPRVCT